MYFNDFIIHELHSLININNLLNTTTYLKENKKKYFYWELNEKYSFKYYADVIFYNYINSYIPNINKQLSIKIRNEVLFGISHLGNVHSLDLEHCNNIHDVCSLGNVYKLNLRYCRADINGCMCDDIKCISCLGNVHI